MPAGPKWETRAQFHRDPEAQRLLRQFMNNKGEGGGVGRTTEFRAGYAYAFEMSDAQRQAVDELRARNEGLKLWQAIDLVLNSGAK